MKSYTKPLTRVVQLSTETIMIEVSGYDDDDSRNTRRKEIGTDYSNWYWQDDAKQVSTSQLAN